MIYYVISLWSWKSFHFSNFVSYIFNASSSFFYQKTMKFLVFSGHSPILLLCPANVVSHFNKILFFQVTLQQSIQQVNVSPFIFSCMWFLCLEKALFIVSLLGVCCFSYLFCKQTHNHDVTSLHGVLRSLLVN